MLDIISSCLKLEWPFLCVICPMLLVLLHVKISVYFIVSGIYGRKCKLRINPCGDNRAFSKSTDIYDY